VSGTGTRYPAPEPAGDGMIRGMSLDLFAGERNEISFGGAIE
jgi:hypothetical protein